jgi:hypothetical protein
MKLSKSVTAGACMPSYSVCSPSVSITTVLQVAPWNRTVSSIFFTLPETPE